MSPAPGINVLSTLFAKHDCVILPRTNFGAKITKQVRILLMMGFMIPYKKNVNQSKKEL